MLEAALRTESVPLEAGCIPLDAIAASAPSRTTACLCCRRIGTKRKGARQLHSQTRNLRIGQRDVTTIRRPTGFRWKHLRCIDPLRNDAKLDESTRSGAAVDRAEDAHHGST